MRFVWNCLMILGNRHFFLLTFSLSLQIRDVKNKWAGASVTNTCTSTFPSARFEWGIFSFLVWSFRFSIGAMSQCVSDSIDSLYRSAFLRICEKNTGLFLISFSIRENYICTSKDQLHVITLLRVVLHYLFSLGRFSTNL